MGVLAQFLSLLLTIIIRCVVSLIAHYPFQPSIKIDNYMNVLKPNIDYGIMTCGSRRGDV